MREHGSSSFYAVRSQRIGTYASPMRCCGGCVATNPSGHTLGGIDRGVDSHFRRRSARQQGAPQAPGNPLGAGTPQPQTDGEHDSHRAKPQPQPEFRRARPTSNPAAHPPRKPPAHPHSGWPKPSAPAPSGSAKKIPAQPGNQRRQRWRISRPGLAQYHFIYRHAGPRPHHKIPPTTRYPDPAPSTPPMPAMRRNGQPIPCRQRHLAIGKRQARRPLHHHHPLRLRLVIPKPSGEAWPCETMRSIRTGPAAARVSNTSARRASGRACSKA